MQGANMGMIQRGNRAGFLFETGAEANLELLDGDDAVQAGVAGFIDFPHAAFAERARIS